MSVVRAGLGDVRFGTRVQLDEVRIELLLRRVDVRAEVRFVGGEARVDRIQSATDGSVARGVGGADEEVGDDEVEESYSGAESGEGYARLALLDESLVALGAGDELLLPFSLLQLLVHSLDLR